MVDTVNAVRSFSPGASRALSECRVEHWGLRLECPTPEDPSVDAEITWLLPDVGVRLTHQRPRSRHARSGPTVITAVRVEVDGRTWRTTDLLLGLAVPGRTTPRIVCAEEFAAAVAGRVLGPEDADQALRTVHRTLEDLSLHRHDIGSWLVHRGIYDTWPAV
ncbi:hypothetical protein GCM10022243_39040 [Saccharothrix violaceirubra]